MVAKRQSKRLSYTSPAPSEFPSSASKASSDQTQSTLSIGSPESPSDGFQQRRSLRKNGHQQTAPLAIQSVIPQEKNVDHPLSNLGNALSLPQAEQLKQQFLQLQMEAQGVEKRVHLCRVAPNFCMVHKEYLGHLQDLLQEYDNKIGRAKLQGEDTILETIDIGPIPMRKRFSSSPEGKSPCPKSSKKACLSDSKNGDGSTTNDISFGHDTSQSDRDEYDCSMETDTANNGDNGLVQTDPVPVHKATSSAGHHTSSPGSDHCETHLTSMEIEPSKANWKPETNHDSTAFSQTLPLANRSSSRLSLSAESRNDTLANISTRVKTTPLNNASEDIILEDSAEDEEDNVAQENHGGPPEIQVGARKLGNKNDQINHDSMTFSVAHTSSSQTPKNSTLAADSTNNTSVNVSPPLKATSQTNTSEESAADEEEHAKQENQAPPEIRVGAKKLRNKQRQVRKDNQAIKMNVTSSALDEYDLYANPILMKDVLLNADESRQNRSTFEESIHEQIDGNTRMEFGYHTKDMLKVILLQLQLTYQHAQQSNPQEKDDPYILFVESDYWREIQGVTSDKQMLRQLLLESPRLLQISATHPYFNSEIFDMDVLTKSIDANLGGELRSGSWFALNQLMCRSTDSWPYHNLNFKEYSRISLNRLVQITQDAVRSLHQLVMLPPLPQAFDPKNHETNGSRAALNFLLARLSGMGAGLQPTEPPANSDGVKSIITKIYELLLGIVLIYEGFQSKSNEIEADSLYLPVFQKNEKGQTEATDDQQLDHTFKIVPAEEWKLMKQRCIGVVALFLLFGVQGWFGCFKNRKKYTYCDIYSIFTLALDMSSRGISILSPQTDPNLHTPWRHLNGFLADLFRTTRIGCPDLNWYTAMYIWGSVLEESTISYFFLLDVFEEMNDPGQSLSSTGSEAPPIKVVNEGWTNSWHELLRQALIKKSAYDTLRGQLALSKGFQPQTIVPALPSRQYEGVDLWNFMQTQCCNTDRQSEKKAEVELVDSL